jgi:glycosyltransferase involved in cell wall biosynthesis
MRIAFLADGGHPNCFRWAEHYAALGARVAVFGFCHRQGTDSGVEYHRLQAPFSRSKLRYLFSAGAARRAVGAWRPDILLGYRLVSYGSVAARTGIRPLVLAAQGQNLVPPGSPPISPWLVRHALRRADLVHAWSEAMAGKMVEFGADRERIVIRPRGVILGDRGAPVGRSDHPVLLSSRQLEPYYNQRLLVETMPAVLRKDPEAELVLCGTGSDEGYLRRRAEELGIASRVRFAGFLGRDELEEELGRAWIYLSAVPTDGVSASLLEAMERGCYPIVVDNESNRAWIGGEEQGGLFPAGDAGALERAILDTLESRERRDRAGEINRRIVLEKADYEKNIRYFLGRYEELLAGRG